MPWLWSSQEKPVQPDLEKPFISPWSTIIPVMKTSEFWYKAKHGPEIDLHRQTLSLSLSLKWQNKRETLKPATSTMNFFWRETFDFFIGSIHSSNENFWILTQSEEWSGNWPPSPCALSLSLNARTLKSETSSTKCFLLETYYFFTGRDYSRNEHFWILIESETVKIWHWVAENCDNYGQLQSIYEEAR